MATCAYVKFSVPQAVFLDVFKASLVVNSGTDLLREKNAFPPVTSCECFCFFFCQEATGVLAFETEDAPFQTHHRKDKEVEILGFESPKVSVKG